MKDLSDSVLFEIVGENDTAENPRQQYDENYFENGMALGISLYENYRWIPELTIPMAHFLIKQLNIRKNESVLDFGCAKGYLVKALRLLKVAAFGCDISEYCIRMVDPEIRGFCRLTRVPYKMPFPEQMHFDWLIAKDVFEHLDEGTLEKILNDAHQRCRKMFVVVPLGKNGRFLVPEYNKDITHVLAKDEHWWERTFESNRWKVQKIVYHMDGLKENWARRYPRGNGLFTLIRD